jgi:hypothetical protein
MIMWQNSSCYKFLVFLQVILFNNHIQKIIEAFLTIDGHKYIVGQRVVEEFSYHVLGEEVMQFNMKITHDPRQ